MVESEIIDLAIQGMEKAVDLTRRLRSLIVPGDDRESAESLSEELLATCDAALSALRSHPSARSKGRKLKLQGGSAAEVRVPDLRGSKRSGKERVTTAPLDDGHQWRKYGEKAIKGRSYKRAYYRCTYSEGKGCPAKKQVEQQPDDPTLFLVLYKGDHTCSSSSAARASSSIKTSTSDPSSPWPQQHDPFLLRFDSPETEMVNGFGNQFAISSHMNAATGDENLRSRSISPCRLAYIDVSEGGASSWFPGGFADADDRAEHLSPFESIQGLFDFDGMSEEFASTSC